MIYALITVTALSQIAVPPAPYTPGQPQGQFQTVAMDPIYSQLRGFPLALAGTYPTEKDCLEALQSSGMGNSALQPELGTRPGAFCMPISTSLAATVGK